MEQFSRYVIRKPLRPHQAEVARLAVPYIINRDLDEPTFTIIMSRQGGKNEFSAHLEGFLLARQQYHGGQIVKVSPTFKPQSINSMDRLALVLDNWWTKRKVKRHFAYIIRVGQAKVLFFSTDKQAQIVGATASLLLEADEAQDIEEAKFNKDVLPMAAVNNAPQVYYGTVWTKRTLLAKQRETNKSLEQRDGVRRHFEYPWDAIAASNPNYGKFVEAQIRKNGIDHPIIKTQYRLIEIDQLGSFISDKTRKLMAGEHFRLRKPGRGEYQYVAGVDFAGEVEGEKDEILRAAKPRQDSTVVTICRVNWQYATREFPYPTLEVVDHYYWTGQNHATQYQQLLHIVRDVWRCVQVICDNTGVGAGVTSFLMDALGGVVVPFDFNQHTKSELGYHFLSTINTERFQMYREDGEQSVEAKEFWLEMDLAQQEARSGQKINFFVPEDEGHDDFLMSSALVTWATNYIPVPPSVAGERIFRRGEDYDDDD